MNDDIQSRKAYVAVYTKLKRQQKAFNDKESGLLVDVRNRLTFTVIGADKAKVVYISAKGKPYKAEFTRNAFILLNQLAHNPHDRFDASEIAKKFHPLRPDSTDERRVRDTIQHIRNKLGLAKNNSEDFFIVESKRFGIGCAVELGHKD